MSSFSMFRRGVLAGLMLAGTAGPAIAQTDVEPQSTMPASEESAQAKADTACTRAYFLASIGGPEYKSGRVDSAKAAAFAYQATANAEGARYGVAPVTTGTHDAATSSYACGTPIVTRVQRVYH